MDLPELEFYDRLLGQRPLSRWKNVTWSLEKNNCGLTELTPKAQADIMDIRNEISGGAPSASTKRRWDNIFRYVLNATTVPPAPIIIRRPEGFQYTNGPVVGRANEGTSIFFAGPNLVLHRRLCARIAGRGAENSSLIRKLLRGISNAESHGVRIASVSANSGTPAE